MGNKTTNMNLASISLCNVDHIGQTTQSIRQRHLGHWAEIRSGAGGLGKHFLSHGQNLNLKQEEIFERNVIQYFELTVIASVEPNQPWTNRKM